MTKNNIRLSPLTDKQKVEFYNKEHEDSYMKLEYLSKKEIIEKYGNNLTEAQIKLLKND